MSRPYQAYEGSDFIVDGVTEGQTEGDIVALGGGVYQINFGSEFSSCRVFTLQTIDDTAAEPIEGVRVTLLDGGSLYSVDQEAGGSATGEIVDDDVAPPTDLVATAVSGSEIDLNFIDTGPNATSIHVERSADGGANWSEVGTASLAEDGTGAFGDTGLDPGMYSYRVRAAGANGNYSEYSNVASATSSVDEPTGLTASEASSSEVDLEFTNNADNLDTFDIERSDDGGSSWSQIGQASGSMGQVTYQDTSITSASGDYIYRVRGEYYDGDLGTMVHSLYSNIAGSAGPIAEPGQWLEATDVEIDTKAGGTFGTTKVVWHDRVIAREATTYKIQAVKPPPGAGVPANPFTAPEAQQLLNFKTTFVKINFAGAGPAGAPWVYTVTIAKSDDPTCTIDIKVTVK